jgi:nicotinamidase-related amidase
MIANHYSYVLVIIDMQNKFMMTGYDDVISKITTMISDAMKDGAYIIFAHYGSLLVRKEGHPESTIWPMLALVNRYEHVSYVNREHRNKAPVIVPVINAVSVDQQIVKVCGLYTDQCVHDTIRGLIRGLPESFKIELVVDACISYNAKGLAKVQHSFQAMGQLRITGDLNKQLMKPQYTIRCAILTILICIFCLFIIPLLK